MTRARDRLGFGQRVILAAGLAAALAVTGGYVITLQPVPRAVSQGGASVSLLIPSAVSLSGGFIGQPAGPPVWQRLLIWLGLAVVWSAAALFLLRGPLPDRGPVPGSRVAAVIGLSAALGAGVTMVPALTSQEAVWLATSAGRSGLIYLPPGLPGWAVLLVLLTIIAAWTAAAAALLRGRGAGPPGAGPAAEHPAGAAPAGP
jgi:hypothetical protein